MTGLRRIGPVVLPRIARRTLRGLDVSASGPLGRRLVPAGPGRELAAVEAGSGQPVILIHGALTLIDDMVLGPFDALAQRYRVAAFDRPGYGGSERLSPADATPWAQAALIHDAAVAMGLERPVVAGHSFGGAVAVAYGLLFPEETAGVVAMAPIVLPEPRLELFLFGPRATPMYGGILARQSRATIDRALLPILWRAMFLPQKMPDRYLRDFPFDLCAREETTIAEGEEAVAIASSLWRSVWSYPTMKPPMVILAGDSDVVINNTLHSAMLSRLAPRSRMISLRGMGHMLHHFEIDAVIGAIEECVASPTAGAGARIETAARIAI